MLKLGFKKTEAPPPIVVVGDPGVAVVGTVSNTAIVTKLSGPTASPINQKLQKMEEEDLKKKSLEVNGKVTDNTPQPAPLPVGGPPIWELVMVDMQERNAIGTKKYNQPLKANDGRDSLVDAYQEFLDTIVYLKKELIDKHRLMKEMANLMNNYALAMEALENAKEFLLKTKDPQILQAAGVRTQKLLNSLKK